MDTRTGNSLPEVLDEHAMAPFAVSAEALKKEAGEFGARFV